MAKTNNSPSSILKELDNVLREGYSPFPVFNDWLDLMLYALTGEEENYLSIVHKYKNNQTKGKREIDYFCNAFGMLMLQMKELNSDILGELYMQWNMNNNYRGQYFTPSHIANFMAQLTNPHGFILDPCCGSGVMLIESIKSMSQEKLDKSIFFGQDIDLTCVKMTSLNLCFFNVDGYIIQGSSLAFECNKVYRTKSSSIGGSIEELKDKQFEDFKWWYTPMLRMEKGLSPTPTTNKIDESEQFTLF